jgi:hypothetical protein
VLGLLTQSEQLETFSHACSHAVGCGGLGCELPEPALPSSSSSAGGSWQALAKMAAAMPTTLAKRMCFLVLILGAHGVSLRRERRIAARVPRAAPRVFRALRARTTSRGVRGQFTEPFGDDPRRSPPTGVGADGGHCREAFGGCVAGGDTDCEALSVCRDEGRCAFAPHAGCVATAAGCARSPLCREQGRCAVDGSSCAVGSSADCAQSERCTRDGACQRSGRRCVKSCRDEQECLLEGRCSDGPLDCVAASAADCRFSEACRERGQCSARAGNCVVLSAKDCKGKTSCGKHGCFVFEGVCMARSACACDFSSGVYAGEEDQRQRQARGEACRRAARQLPAGVCQPKP